MADCGCGCGGAGNCNDNLDSISKNAQVTGNLKWDGANQSCGNDSSIDIVTDEGMNSVLQKMWNKLCSLSKQSSYLAHLSRDNELTEPISTRQSLDLFEFIGDNNIKDGEMIRVTYMGSLSTVVGTGRLDIDVNVYGKDSAGVYTAPVTFISEVVPAGQTIVDQFFYQIEITKVTDTILRFTIDGKTRLGSINENISSVNQVMADLSTHDLVLDFTALRDDAGDTFELEYVSMEHVRP